MKKYYYVSADDEIVAMFVDFKYLNSFLKVAHRIFDSGVKVKWTYVELCDRTAVNDVEDNEEVPF